jgi:hypothetical protein
VGSRSARSRSATLGASRSSGGQSQSLFAKKREKEWARQTLVKERLEESKCRREKRIDLVWDGVTYEGTAGEHRFIDQVKQLLSRREADWKWMEKQNIELTGEAKILKEVEQVYNLNKKTAIQKLWLHEYATERPVMNDAKLDEAIDLQERGPNDIKLWEQTVRRYEVIKAKAAEKKMLSGGDRKGVLDTKKLKAPKFVPPKRIEVLWRSGRLTMYEYEDAKKVYRSAAEGVAAALAIEENWAEIKPEFARAADAPPSRTIGLLQEEADFLRKKRDGLGDKTDKALTAVLAELVIGQNVATLLNGKPPLKRKIHPQGPQGSYARASAHMKMLDGALWQAAIGAMTKGAIQAFNAWATKNIDGDPRLDDLEQEMLLLEKKMAALSDTAAGARSAKAAGASAHALASARERSQHLADKAAETLPDSGEMSARLSEADGLYSRPSSRMGLSTAGSDGGALGGGEGSVAGSLERGIHSRGASRGRGGLGATGGDAGDGGDGGDGDSLSPMAASGITDWGAGSSEWGADTLLTETGGAGVAATAVQQQQQQQQQQPEEEAEEEQGPRSVKRDPRCAGTISGLGSDGRPPAQRFGHQPIRPLFVPNDVYDLFCDACQAYGPFCKWVRHVRAMTGEAGAKAHALKKSGKKTALRPATPAESDVGLELSQKALDRCCNKVVRSAAPGQGRFRDLLDLVRGSLVYDKMRHLVQAVQVIRESEGVRVVRVKNRFDQDCNTDSASCGYRQVVFNVQLDGFPHVCELTLQLRGLHDIKKVLAANADGYAKYLVWRDNKIGIDD